MEQRMEFLDHKAVLSLKISLSFPNVLLFPFVKLHLIAQIFLLVGGNVLSFYIQSHWYLLRLYIFVKITYFWFGNILHL